MWNNEGLKNNAKQLLKRNYWGVFIVSLIFSLLSGGNSSFNINIPVNNYSYDLDFFNQFMSYEFLLSILALLSASAIIGIIFQIFVISPISVGQKRYLMENREPSRQGLSISRIFCVFNSGYYMNVVKIMFFMKLKIFLWSLLFVIPGIVKSLQYEPIPYILAENPDISMDRVFDISKAMTHNEKLDIFILQLSFIGWFFLGLMACGIGVFFVQPYIDVTFAELYAALRQKAFDKNISDYSELLGFHV